MKKEHEPQESKTVLALKTVLGLAAFVYGIYLLVSAI